MHIHELARLAGAHNRLHLPAEFAALEPCGFSIDSRTVRAGELFFAVTGEVFDGHAFVKAALDRGACGAVIAKELPELSEADRSRCLMVADPLRALQDLAHNLLAEWGKPIIGITGSMGKTTTKEMTARVLEQTGRVHKSVGNLNNAYGLPLTVLKMISDGANMEDFDFAVLEMGMSFAGEITRLTEIAPPWVSVVVNVAPVHLENFSSIEGIATAKAEIVQGMRSDGTAILNADDERVYRMAKIAFDERHPQARLLTFGRHELAHVTAHDVVTNGLLGSRFTLVTPKGSAPVALSLPGEHFILNALAAAASGLRFGLTPEVIAQALSTTKAAYHRGEILTFEAGFTMVDDTYNSNPTALQEATKLLAAVPAAGRTVLVAGEMLELGPEAARLHAECGKLAAQLGIGLIVGVRGLAADLLQGAREAGMAETQLHFAADSAAAGLWLAEQVGAGDVVLVKGSRGVKTELVIEQLKERFGLAGMPDAQAAHVR
ncbi:MAG: UDP-N-acetylmuramoyl-tripeptide--D-alanyl-D-alanine ligase [Blastocatellia bacterium]|nr:UDP-N-acetylmuramoyl-tripeptide--D-alanyl-D-alanine ligase [Blastocatellia bacterium]